MPRKFIAVGDVWVDVGGVRVAERLLLDVKSLIDPSKSKSIERCEIEWILIRPGKFQIGGVEFRCRRPFYISTVELPNAVDILRRSSIVQGGLSLDQFADDRVKRHGERHWLSPDKEDDRRRLSEDRRYWLRPNAPIIDVDSISAYEICDWLSGAAEVDVRLPTMAEWGVASLGGAATRYWWGETFDGSKVVWAGCTDLVDFVRDIADVETGPANQFGLHHVIGNLAEIARCSDDERDKLSAWSLDHATDLPESKRGSVGFAEFMSFGLHFVPPQNAFVALGGSADAPGFPNPAIDCLTRAANGFDYATQDIRRVMGTSAKWGSLPYKGYIPLVGIRPAIDVPLSVLGPVDVKRETRH